jgi:hypothetical protein
MKPKRRWFVVAIGALILVSGCAGVFAPGFWERLDSWVGCRTIASCNEADGWVQDVPVGSNEKEMQMRIWFAVAIAVVSAAASQALASDETLKFYLARSQYVLAGELVAEPVKEARPFYWGADKKNPIVVYTCRVKVLEQFQDNPYSHKEMTVYVLRHDGSQRPDGLRKGEKCIFFLNWIYGGPGVGSSHVTSDAWFGVQRYDPRMAERLRELGKRPPRVS